jgi:integrase
MRRERGTGSLRLRGTIWWLRYFHHGKLVEESSHTSDEREAKKLLRKKLKAADTPLYVAPSAQRVTYEDLADLVRRDYARKENRSSLTARLAHLAAAFAGWPALAITSVATDTYTDERLASGAAVGTVNRELNILRRAFNLALEKQLLPTAPKITFRREDNVREGFVDPADLEPLLAALRARDAVVADVAEAAFLTLLRRGNVVRLAWPMCSLTVEGGHVVGGALRLPGTVTKNKKALMVPLTGRLLALIDRRWRARIETCPAVFHRQGVPVRDFRKTWRRTVTALGRPGLLLHDLRRSGARTLIRAGVPEDIVMKMGGWKTRSMLTRYNIVDTADLADAQAKLDAALATPGPRKVVALR